MHGIRRHGSAILLLLALAISGCQAVSPSRQAMGAEGLVVLDVVVPGSPTVVGRLDTPRLQWSVEVHGSLAPVGDGRWFRVIGISTPAMPRELATYKFPARTNDVVVAGGTTCVAAYDAGLCLLQLTSGDARRLGQHVSVRRSD